MKNAIIVCAAGLLALACATRQQAEAPEGEKAELVAAGAGAASFHPGGDMFVFTQGMTLVVGRTGDDRLFHLTTSPPSEAPTGEEAAETDEEAPEEQEAECVAADPRAPVPGPQGGWHGHAAWSPDGRFIAFIAPWKDGNCNDADDADWDVWIVGVDGLDLDAWVKEVVPDENDPEVKNHYIVGPDAAGLQYFQVTNTIGREKRPAWAGCRQLSFATEAGVHLVDLAGFPGICEKTAAELASEREAQIQKLTSRISDLEGKITGLEAKVTALQTPPEDEASKAPAPKPPAKPATE